MKRHAIVVALWPSSPMPNAAKSAARTAHLGFYGPDEVDHSAVLILGDTHAPLLMSKSESVMYAVLQGKQLSYSDWVQVGIGGDAKVISKIARKVRFQSCTKRDGYKSKANSTVTSLLRRKMIRRWMSH